MSELFFQYFAPLIARIPQLGNTNFSQIPSSHANVNFVNNIKVVTFGRVILVEETMIQIGTEDIDFVIHIDNPDIPPKTHSTSETSLFLLKLQAEAKSIAAPPSKKLRVSNATDPTIEPRSALLAAEPYSQPHK